MSQLRPRRYANLRLKHRFARAVVELGICVSLFLSAKALAPNAETLQMGPVYTSPDGKNYPEFPRLQVVLASAGAEQAAPKPAELSLAEDGVESVHASSVETFESTGYGLAAVVAIDVSGSMAGKPLNIVRQSLYKFVSESRPQDSVGVVTIADDATWDVPFGTDQATMKTRLQAIHMRGTMTRLFDGLLNVLGGFNSSLPARRELTIISDGHDEGSRSHLEDVVQMARDRGIAIDTIGLTRSAPAYLQTLSKLASETGGSYHQVHSDQELEALIGNGMTRLKATPVATFEAKRISGDGKRHRLGVHWMAASDLSSETTFLAPKLNGPQVVRSLKHMPAWGYAVLAAVCFVLLFALIGIIRPLRRREQVGDVPYALPRQPTPPPAPGKKTDFESEPLAPPNVRKRVEAVRANQAEPPAIQKPEAPAVVRNKQTRIAGIFDAAGETIARLEILTGVLSGTSVDIPRGEFSIGASGSNQFVLSNDATISSRHAYLLFEDPILMLVDNHSTNGTRINGQLVRGSRQSLHDGDQIQIGQTLLRLRSIP